MQVNDAVKSIGELALEVPNAINVLEKWQIDYCCHGSRSIEEACTEAGHTVEELYAQIGLGREAAPGSDWQRASLQSLQEYIVATHHVFTREVMDTIVLLADKVAKRHGPRHPETVTVNELASAMYDDLIPHMLKEEQVLFPYVAALEKAIAAGDAAPQPFFGTVKNPITMMMNEHEAVGDLLVQLRRVTNEYTLPEDACLSFRALYERLMDIEKDLHRHIHLENNVLFPRASAMESEVRPGIASSHAKHACGCSA